MGLEIVLVLRERKQEMRVQLFGHFDFLDIEIEVSGGRQCWFGALNTDGLVIYVSRKIKISRSERRQEPVWSF